MTNPMINQKRLLFTLFFPSGFCGLLYQTTFRSLMSWDIQATAVELVPSAKDAFPYYFDDAQEVMGRPHGKIVIDDGRRFLRRTVLSDANAVRGSVGKARG